MSLERTQIPYIGRSVVPHGKDGVAVRLPNTVRDEANVTTDKSVDLEYDREERTVTIHLPETETEATANEETSLKEEMRQLPNELPADD